MQLLITTTVPDLAFNELKFLRNHDEHQDEHQLDDTHHEPSHQRKKRHAEREEISAYFNQRKSDNGASHPSPRKPRASNRRSILEQVEPSSVQGGGSSPILPEEELTAKPYLGFGSRGAVNQSSHPQPSGTTYLTWSETEAEPDMRANNILNHKSAQELDQLSTPKVLENLIRKRRKEFRSINDIANEPMQENHFKVQHGQWSASRRIRGPTGVETYTQRNEARHDPRAATQEPHDSTSLSLPTRPLADSALVQRQDRQQKRQVLPSDAESFRTSDILKIRGRLSALADKPLSDVHHIDASQSNKENVQPASSSPMAKILRTAHQAISKTREEPIRQPSRRSDHVYSRLHETEPGISSHLHALQSHQLRETFPRKSAGGQLTRQPLHPPSSVPEQYADQRVRREDLFEASYTAVHPEDDEMLDNVVESQPRIGSDQAFAYAHSNMHSISHQHVRPSIRARDISWSRSGLSNVFEDTLSRVATADRSVPADQDHFDGINFDDGLEGFWRPNRLY